MKVGEGNGPAPLGSQPWPLAKHPKQLQPLTRACNTWPRQACPQTTRPTPARTAAHGQHLLRGISLPASLDASRQRQRQRGQLHTANTCSEESRCLHHSTPHVNASRQRQRQRGQLHTASSCSVESRCLHHSVPHVNANASAASLTRPTPAQGNLVAWLTQRLTSMPTPTPTPTKRKGHAPRRSPQRESLANSCNAQPRAC